MKEKPTKKRTRKPPDPDMRAEYDFSGGIRGKYAAQFRSGTNLILLEPDVAQAFPDAKAVNAALRGLLAIARRADNRQARRSTT